MAKKKSKGQQKQQKRLSPIEYLRTRMRSLPIGKCYIGPAENDGGEVTVFVTREHPAGTVSAGIYLIDKYCCGVKDALYYFSIDRDEFEDILDDYSERIGLRELPYVEAHNIIYGAKAYAEDIGIPAHKDFDSAQYILAEDNDDIPLIEYEFGKDGKPMLICSSTLQLNYYRGLMLKVIGPDDFDTLLLAPPSGFENRLMSEDCYIDDDDDDSYEMVIQREGHKDGIPIKRIGNLTTDLESDIKKLGTVRKVAYFIMMAAAAKRIKLNAAKITPFVNAANDAIMRYRKYGDVAFGEATQLLYEAIKSTFEILCSPACKDLEHIESGEMLNFCIGYSFGLAGVNLEQSYNLEKTINDTDKAEDMMLGFLCAVVEYTLNYFRDKVASEKDGEPDKKPLLRVSLKDIADTWHSGGVRTHVKQPKYGFISKDPDNYYRRKVKEAIDTRFADEEDFMGLVFVFYNMTLSALNMIEAQQIIQAYHILSNILSETLWTVASGKFDQWIAPGSDVRNSLRVMLCNTVIILANMIYLDYISLTETSGLYSDANRLVWILDNKYGDLVDLHPLIYSFDQRIKRLTI